jgi:hypothetical protein
MGNEDCIERGMWHVDVVHVECIGSGRPYHHLGSYWSLGSVRVPHWIGEHYERETLFSIIRIVMHVFKRIVLWH